MFVAIALGALTQHLLSRSAPWLPYTAVLLVEGILIAFIHEGCNHSLGTLSKSIVMWQSIDAHLLLYAFLPALLFGDSMSLNVHMFSKCFMQCFILACPGVLLGTFLNGLCARYFLPYDWNWELSLAFGSILSATDPVAVVALLKSLGASPVLTMQITGESLLNDGTAIVLFTLFFNMYHDCTKTVYTEYSTLDIVEFFARMALGGPALGIAFGLVTNYWMRRVSRKTVETDMTVQIALTFCCAYLSFFVAESEAGVSGVLCTVFAALVLAKETWPAVCNEHSMHTVWEAVEYLGNTLIFMLAGVITGTKIWVGMDTNIIQGEDWGYLFVMFACMTAVRAIMMVLFYPLLARIGYGTSPKDAFFMTWGGLRGAVGLALAMVVNSSIDPIQGTRVIFHVGCLAVLTLLVNGITSGPILAALGMLAPPHRKELLVHQLQDRIQREIREELNDQRNRHHEFAKIKDEDLQQYCTVLKERVHTKDDNADAQRTEVNEETMALVREVFLHVLKSEYWHVIEVGKLPRKGNAALMLLNSVDCAVDRVDIPLHDWDTLEPTLHVSPWVLGVMAWIDRVLPDAIEMDGHLKDYWVTTHEMRSYYIATCFIDAHQHAQNKVASYFGEGGEVDSPEEHQVAAESRAMCERAQRALDEMDPILAVKAKQTTLAQILLGKQADIIHKLQHQGLLNGQEVDSMMEVVSRDIHLMHVDRRKLAKNLTKLHVKLDDGVIQLENLESQMGEMDRTSANMAATTLQASIRGQQSRRKLQVD
jgi:NhaP-type Na+/H+ or K+/H+ antiporter